MNNIKYLLIIAMIFTITLLRAQSQDNINYNLVKFKISNSNENCKTKIEKGLGNKKGIVESILDTNTRILSVKYDPKKTDVIKIIKKIIKIGYKAEVVKGKKEPLKQYEL